MSSVFETFYIMFKGDTSQLKTGIRDVDDQTKILGRTVANTDARLSRMLRRSISILAVFGSLKAAFEYSEELYAASQALDANIESLGAWSSAVVKVGGEADTFQKSLSKFAQTFNLTADQALAKLPQLAEQLHGLGKIQALKVGQELGFDEKTILLLSKGREEVELLIKRQKELGLVTKEDAKAVHDFRLVWEDTIQVANVFSSKMLGDVLPILGKFFTWIQDGVIYLNKYPYIIEGLTTALGVLSTVLTIIAAKTVLAFIPFGALGLAVLAVGAAAILAYDDVKTFFNGGDSLIGKALVQWPKLGKVFESFADYLKNFTDTLEYALLLFEKGIFEAPSFEDFRNTKYGLSPLGSPAELVERSGKDKLKALNILPEVNLPELPTFNQPPIPASIGAQGSAMRQIINNYNTDKIEVMTQATDGAAVLRELTTAMENQNRQAPANFDDGVMG